MLLQPSAPLTRASHVRLSFRFQHVSAAHLSGAINPPREESDQLLSIQGLSDHPVVHRVGGVDPV